MVSNIIPGHHGSYPASLTDVSGMLFFVVDDGVNGEELWKSNGRASGTMLVADIWPGEAGWRPER